MAEASCSVCWVCKHPGMSEVYSWNIAGNSAF